MKNPFSTRSLTLVSCLAVSSLFACGGGSSAEISEEMGADEAGEVTDALVTDVRTLWKNQATGRCLRRVSGYLRVDVCDQSDVRQLFRAINSGLRTSALDASGNPTWVHRNGLWNPLRIGSATDFGGGSSRELSFQHVTLTTSVIRNPEKTNCIADLGADSYAFAVMAPCDGSPNQVWEQQ